MQNQPTLPSLPLDEWEQSKITLNYFLQIAGKIRLGLMPRKNHWWYLTLYVSPRGLTTHAIPLDDGFNTFELTFNFISHQVELHTSRGEAYSFPLEDGLSVAAFYQQMFDLLKKIGVELEIIDRPIDMPLDAPFSEIETYNTYQPAYVAQFWRALTWVDHVFKEFGGRFYGKTCPVHLYWHHMDLAVTRFSGKRGPVMEPQTRLIEKDAYSHEVISFGFWAGDDNVRGAAFYCYTFPSPEGLDTEPLQPQAASWVDSNGSPMALLMYDDLRREADPKAALLDFLESAYQAGAKRAEWDVPGFTVPSLRDL
ncbi:MAG: DUF5996 family protein [Bacteroidota bacterium]